MLSLLLLTPAVAAAEVIKIEKGACEQVVRHVPTPDVDYQPGVDAYGRPVAGADIEPQVQLPPVISIPLTVDLARGFNLPVGQLRGTEATVGIIRLEGNKAYLNGQPLQPEAEENLAILCMKANRGEGRDSGSKAGKIK